MWNATFRLLTASLLQAMRSTGSGTALYIMVVCCDWCISIWLLFPCTMASSGVRWFFVRRWFRCFFYCRHPRFRYFDSVVSVYFVWAESCVNCLFHFPCVSMAFSVNMLKKTKQLIAWITRFTLDKWFETTFLPIVDNWVKWKYFLGIIIKRIKFKLLDQSYLFSALRSGIFRT